MDNHRVSNKILCVNILICLISVVCNIRHNNVLANAVQFLTAACSRLCICVVFVLYCLYICVVVTLTPTYQTDIRDVLYVGEELTLTCAITGAPASFLLGIVFDDDASKEGPQCFGPTSSNNMPDDIKLLEGIMNTDCGSLPDPPLSIKIEVHNSLLLFKTQCAYGTSFVPDQFEDFALPGKIFGKNLIF